MSLKQTRSEKDGKGRHTTVRRQLTILRNGSIFIDTPGMRELGNFNLKSALEQTFTDLAAYTAHCRYRNCTHTHETGCAVIAALQEGKISEQQYQNYLKLRQKSEFYDMLYQHKRQKDQDFSKIKKDYKNNYGKNKFESSSRVNALP